MNSLERRAREIRRQIIRAWEYRQRHHAHGVWFRLRRVLADARAAYAISRPDAEALIAAGHTPEPVGAELAPPKILLFIDAEQATRLPSARPIQVRLTGELLAVECLALVRFDR
jgi:hypothetical protein